MLCVSHPGQCETSALVCLSRIFVTERLCAVQRRRLTCGSIALLLETIEQPFLLPSTYPTAQVPSKQGCPRQALNALHGRLPQYMLPQTPPDLSRSGRAGKPCLRSELYTLQTPLLNITCTAIVSPPLPKSIRNRPAYLAMTHAQPEGRGQQAQSWHVQGIPMQGTSSRAGMRLYRLPQEAAIA